MNRRQFVRTTVGATLAGAGARTLLAQTPNVMTPKSRKPVVIASANGNKFKNGGEVTCVQKAFTIMTQGADVLEALIAGVNIVELDPDLLLPYLISRRGRSQEALVEILAAEIESGQTSGTIRPGDPILIARSLTLAGHGFVLSAQTMTDAGVGFADLDAEYARLITRTLEP